MPKQLMIEWYHCNVWYYQPKLASERNQSRWSWKFSSRCNILSRQPTDYHPTPSETHSCTTSSVYSKAAQKCVQFGHSAHPSNSKFRTKSTLWLFSPLCNQKSVQNVMENHLSMTPPFGNINDSVTPRSNTANNFQGLGLGMRSPHCRRSIELA